MSTTLRKSFAYSVAAGALALNMASATPAWSQGAPLEPEGAKINQTIKTSSPQTFTKQGVTPNPILPWEIIFGIGGLGLLFSAYAGRNNVKMGIPYMLASGIIVSLLINPVWNQEEHENIPAEVIVAIDKSASQSIGNREDIEKQASAELLEKLSALPDVNIRVVEIEDSTKNTGTPLFKELEKLHDIPKQHAGGVFVITDGQIHGTPERSPFSPETPIYGLLTGQADEKDRAIEVISAPPFALVDEEQKIKFKVNDFGTEATSPVTVTITNGDQVVDTLHDVIPGEVREVQLKIPHSGTNTIGFEVQEMEGELTKKNNRILTKIEGIREDLNVLLISGTINKNLKSVGEFFKSDPDSNLIHFSMVTLPRDYRARQKNEKIALTPFPRRDIFGKTLKEFDLVVFDGYEDYGSIPRPYMKRLDKYVQEGGAILNISGPEYAGARTLGRGPVGKILPTEQTRQVVKGAFKPEITQTGHRHPVTRGLPKGNRTPDTQPEWGSWSRYAKATAKSGHILMQSPNGDPILVLDHYGEGRVATLLSNDLWLWKRGFEGGGPQAEMLRRLSHWLMKNPILEEEALRIQTQEDKVVVTRQTLSEELPEPAEIETPSGEIIDVPFEKAENGLWHATIPADEKGLYKATHQHDGKTLTTFTSVKDKNTREFDNVVSTGEILRPLIAQTPGAIHRINKDSDKTDIPDIVVANSKEEAAPDAFHIRPTNQTILKEVKNTPIFSMPGVQFLMALLFIATIGAGLARDGDQLNGFKKLWQRNKKSPKP